MLAPPGEADRAKIEQHVAVAERSLQEYKPQRCVCGLTVGSCCIRVRVCATTGQGWAKQAFKFSGRQEGDALVIGQAAQHTSADS